MLGIINLLHSNVRAIYPGGARAPLLLRVGVRRDTGLEQLQMPNGKILALFD